jgi:hypothetical protein
MATGFLAPEDDLTRALVNGHHFGSSGSLSLAKSEKDPLRRVNVYYTVASWLVKRGGILNKVRGVCYLYMAKTLCEKTLAPLVEDMDRSRCKGNEPMLTVGDVYGELHVLLSCQVRWAQVKQKLRLRFDEESAYAHKIHHIIMWGGPQETKAISCATMFESAFAKNQDQKEFWRAVAHNFIAKNEDTNDLGVGQAVIRCMRSLGHQVAARELAERLNLGDQVAKSQPD